MNNRYWSKAKTLSQLIDEFFIVPFFGTVSRLVFGNNAGFFNNIIGRAFRNTNIKDPLKYQKAYELNKNGFVNISLHESQNIISSIAMEIDDIFSNAVRNRDKLVSAGGKDYEDKHIILKNPLRLFPEISQLMNEEILLLLEGYYKKAYAIKHIRIWRNYGVTIDQEASNLFSNQWHNDQFKTSRIKLFVYLSPTVDERTGATQMMNKLNTKTIMQSMGYFRRSWVLPHTKKMMNNSSYKRILNGKRGDAFFLNATELLHRAGIPATGHHRDIIQFEFDGASKPIPMAEQLKMLELALENDGFKD